MSSEWDPPACGPWSLASFTYILPLRVFVGVRAPAARACPVCPVARVPRVPVYPVCPVCPVCPVSPVSLPARQAVSMWLSCGRLRREPAWEGLSQPQPT